LRVEPRTQKDLAGWAAGHVERSGRFGAAEHIDSSRSERNFVVAGYPPGQAGERLEKIIEHYGLACRRKDGEQAVVAEIILTANQKYFQAVGEERTREFCQRAATWLESKFGQEAVLSVVAHFDEEAPHIHAFVVPLAETRQKIRFGESVKTKVNYTALFGDSWKTLKDARNSATSHTDTKLGRLQTEAAEVFKDFGLVRGQKSRLAKHQRPRRGIPAPGSGRCPEGSDG
jgi:hypothetical protein